MNGDIIIENPYKRVKVSHPTTADEPSRLKFDIAISITQAFEAYWTGSLHSESKVCHMTIIDLILLVGNSWNPCFIDS